MRTPRTWIVIAACAIAIAGSIVRAEVPDAHAATEAEMKPYTEVVKVGDKTFTFKMIPIKGGTFKLGSPESEPLREPSEGPQVEVKVEPFWMGVCEVTWGEYLPFMNRYHHFADNPPPPLPEDKFADAVSLPTPDWEEAVQILNEMGRDDNYPAVRMTQLAAKQYTKWISKLTGRFYRLPTEAEWEYAARAGTTTAYSFGDDAAQLPEYGWFFDNADDKYHPVMQKKPNPWGLYDMHGNAAEWTLDQYIEDHYGKFVGKGPVNAADIVAWPTEIDPRVVRGGSWLDDPEMLRSAARLPSEGEDVWKEKDPQRPTSIWYDTVFFVGFRVIRPLSTPPASEQLRYWEADHDYLRQEMVRDEKQRRVLVQP